MPQGRDGPEVPATPEVPPGYPGQMPPGGWAYPAAPPRPPWAGAPLASWGSRVAATLLDWLVLLVATVLLAAPGVALLLNHSTAAGVVALVVASLVTFVVYVFYGAYFTRRPGKRNGQTLGKQWVGIRAVRDNGEPFGLGEALLREFVVKIVLFVWVAGSFFFGIPSLLDYLWPLWEDENRALHDLIVKTHVVRG